GIGPTARNLTDADRRSTVETLVRPRRLKITSPTTITCRLLMNANHCPLHNDEPVICNLIAGRIQDKATLEGKARIANSFDIPLQIRLIFACEQFRQRCIASGFFYDATQIPELHKRSFGQVSRSKDHSLLT